MTRFNRPSARPPVRGPVETTGERILTHEGAPAYARTAKSDLVLMALGSFYGQATLYEESKVRESRFSKLVRTVALEDPAWLAAFVTWLRSEANMRTAALVAAGEQAHGMIEPGVPGARKVISSALLRADEPGEFLAYWTANYGRKLPMAVKRGVGDAALRLYNERSLLKYDTNSHGFRFGDVLELTHPGDTKGAAQHLAFPAQGDLFRHAIDRRHGREGNLPESLPVLRANTDLRKMAKDEPAILLSPSALKAAGMTWEDALSLGGQHGLDKRRLWEAMIPSMGYMALLRNLRNFDDAGIPDSVAQRVMSRLADLAEVERSRQLPFRFFSAYRQLNTLRWGHALEIATSLSCVNVPGLEGTSLVCVDLSGSMDRTVSDRSQISYKEVGALFAAVLAERGEAVTVVPYGTTYRNLGILRPGSVLRNTEKILACDVGYGTETYEAVSRNYAQQSKVFVFTDEQSWGDTHPSWMKTRGGDLTTAVPVHIPLFAFNLAGHAPSSLDLSQPNRFALGGFTDKLFTLVKVLLEGRGALWPWEE